MGQLHPLHQEVRLLNFKTQRAFVLSKQIEFPKTSSGQPSNVFVLSLFYVSNISQQGCAGCRVVWCFYRDPPGRPAVLSARRRAAVRSTTLISSRRLPGVCPEPVLAKTSIISDRKRKTDENGCVVCMFVSLSLSLCVCVCRALFGTFAGYQKALTIADSPNIGACLCLGCWLEGGKEQVHFNSKVHPLALYHGYCGSVFKLITTTIMRRILIASSPLYFEISLRLSRACLGKMILFLYI